MKIRAFLQMEKTSQNFATDFNLFQMGKTEIVNG